MGYVTYYIGAYARSFLGPRSTRRFPPFSPPAHPVYLPLSMPTTIATSQLRLRLACVDALRHTIGDGHPQVPSDPYRSVVVTSLQVQVEHVVQLQHV